MESHLQSAVSFLNKTYKALENEYQGQVTVVLAAEHLIAALTRLRDEFSFEMLEMETAVDYWPQESPRFHVIYQLTSITKIAALQIRVPVGGDQPEVPTVTGVFASANWRERELWDMFGIRFAGHPDPRRILNPPDADYHPLRKDYPLGYEEPQFTFNFEEIDLRKPYAKE